MREQVSCLWQILRNEPKSKTKQRQRLRERLTRIFQMDAISASLESLSRRCLVKGGLR